MEFNEKLQELRKQKGITQEELAESLFVSRTAISKWESGRGYPSIDSLKEIASFFKITIDELLSSEALLTIAEKDSKQKQGHFRDLVFGLLDFSALLLVFLPLFADRTAEVIASTSLLSLLKASRYITVLYLAFILAVVVVGVLTLALQTSEYYPWKKCKVGISLAISSALVLLLIVSLQPYAAAFAFVLLAIKALFLYKTV